MLPAPAQVTGVDEITRHDGPSVICSWPDVTVSSAYVESGFALHVPLTCRDPVTGAERQPVPANDRSSSPDTSRQDETTVQVPLTSPVQGVTFEQVGPAPPLPRLPPLLPAPPRLADLPPALAPADPPAVPEGLFVGVVLHAAEVNKQPLATATTDDRICIRSLSKTY